MTQQCSLRLQAAAVLSLLVAGGCTKSADCRSEVEAAFQRLETPGRPYRIEMTNEHQRPEDLGALVPDIRETDEFIPPDRMRRIISINHPTWRKTIDYFAADPSAEVIRVGKRTWIRLNKEWKESFEEGGQPARHLFPTFPTGAGLSEATVECLGTVEFEGRTYAGYRTSLPRIAATLTLEVPGRPSQISKMQQEEVSAKLKQQPAVWRTILVEVGTGLPAYEIAAPADQLDSPKWSRHYTYPRDIMIESPTQ